MAVSARDKKGRAAPPVETEDLYTLVRLIARSARPGDPERITQRAFDAAREVSGHQGVPKATTICARLAHRRGTPMPWREVLDRALDETASSEHAERRRLGEAEAAHMDGRHVIYALRLIAQRMGVKSLTPDDYGEERRVVLAAEGRRRNLRRDLQAELLPTVGQVERIMRNLGRSSAEWDEALALAELEPRSTLRDQRHHRGPYSDSLPMVEAIHHYVEANGELPSKNDFDEFRKTANVKVERRAGGWKQQLKAAIAYRETLGFTEPTEFPTIARRRGKKRLPVRVPEGGIPGAASRVLKGQTKHSESDCIAAVRRFLEEGERPYDQRGYRAFASRHGLPAPSLLEPYGGWGKLRAKARAQRRS